MANSCKIYCCDQPVENFCCSCTDKFLDRRYKQFIFLFLCPFVGYGILILLGIFSYLIFGLDLVCKNNRPDCCLGNSTGFFIICPAFGFLIIAILFISIFIIGGLIFAIYFCVSRNYFKSQPYNYLD